MSKRFASYVATMAAMVFGLGVGPSAVNAAGSEEAPDATTASACGGPLVAYAPIKKGSTTIGNVYLYSNGHTGYCAITRHVGPTYGVKLVTIDEIFEPSLGNAARAVDNREVYYSTNLIKFDPHGGCVYALGGVHDGAAYGARTGTHCNGN